MFEARDDCAVFADALVVKLDSAAVMFWRPSAGSFQIWPQYTEAGEQVTIDDLRDVDGIVFMPLADFVEQFQFPEA
jgi:hypothetical protein